MNLRALDLNLLVVLHALLEEVHVTRAARRLALSQPATSSALERCRRIFRDALLEKVGGKMRLTPKAQTLREPLAQALAAVSAVVEAPSRDLRQVKQTVRILMSDFPAIMVLPGLLTELAASAPLINVAILPWHGGADTLHRLESGELDIAVAVLPALGPEYRRIELLREHYVVAMRAGHPAVKRFNTKTWLEHPHVLVSGQGATSGALDEALMDKGLMRRVALVVPSFMMVEPLLLESNLIAMLPSLCVSRSNKRLTVFKPPLAVPGFTMHIAWHTRRDADAGVQHVASVVRRLLDSMDGAAPRGQRSGRAT
jgi:DNA-binding transcriptional LysR family regulator